MIHPKVLLRDAPGECLLLLGNEAIARGALEAGVGVMTTYPGTPASEIGDSIASIAKEAGLYMEYSTNEIVALETAAGASISGVRALTAMKHVGLNVAADALMTLAYTGVRAGLTVVTADDPNCYSSQNEQDNRYYAMLANLPCFEPSDAQEAKEMVLHSMETSENLELPCLLRSTTRISHTRASVVLGPIKKPQMKGEFKRDVGRFVMIPANARPQHQVLLRKMEQARSLSESCSLNRITGGGSEVGIISSGAAYNYAVEAIDLLDLDAGILKLGMTHPLPEKKIAEFIRTSDQIVVVEELEPYLELQVRSIASSHALGLKIHGKMHQAHFPRFGELSTRLVADGLSRIFGKDFSFPFGEASEKYGRASQLLLPRPPILCPGCPHRASFYVIRRATGGKAIYATDIGCYALGVQPPLKIGDLLVCMGASVGTACGISKVSGKEVVAVLGDSTFFHAAIPGLINAVYNQHKVTLVVLDNLTTAMTGFQPHPGTGTTAMHKRTKKVLVEEVARGCGVEDVHVINPFKVEEATKTLKDAIKTPGPSVMVFREPCALTMLAERRRRGEPVIPVETTDDCRGVDCLACIKLLGCPALYVQGDTVLVNDALCNGCMLCVSVCPYGAIERRKESR